MWLGGEKTVQRWRKNWWMIPRLFSFFDAQFPHLSCLARSSLRCASALDLLLFPFPHSFSNFWDGLHGDQNQMLPCLHMSLQCLSPSFCSLSCPQTTRLHLCWGNGHRPLLARWPLIGSQVDIPSKAACPLARQYPHETVMKDPPQRNPQ